MSIPPTNWTRYLVVLAGVCFVCGVWISLFTAGILVDSEPYRRVISPQGVGDLGANEWQTERDSLTGWRILRDSVALRIAPSGSVPRDTSGETAPARLHPDLYTALPDSTREAFFVMGTSAPADSTRRTSIVAPPQLPTESTLWAFIVVLVSFTPPNLAFLCCTAGVLGAMGRRLVLSTQRDVETLDRSYPFLSAIVRGFFVYLAVISGILVLLENPILGTVSPGQYIRFAGLLSLLSFFVNYDPTMFAALLDRVRDRMAEDAEQDERRRNGGDAPSSNE